MINKMIILGLIAVCFLVSFSILNVLFSSAFFNTTEDSTENILNTGEWVPAKTALILQQDGQTISNEESISSHSDANGENYKVAIDSTKKLYLSFLYKLSSTETADLFDTPVVIIKIGQIPVLQISIELYDIDWHLAQIDISNLNLETGVYDINFSLQNTFDDLHIPSFEIKDVTTKKLFTKPGYIVKFTTSKPVAKVFIEHSIWENDEEVVVQKELDFYENNLELQWQYTIPDNFSGTQLSYWSVDLFNNIEEKNKLEISHQNEVGFSFLNSEVFIETENELTLEFEYQNLNDSPKYFEMRSDSSPMLTQADWEQATPIPEKKYHKYSIAKIPTQNNSGTFEKIMVFESVPSGLQYISVKVCSVANICKFVITNQQLEYPL